MPSVHKYKPVAYRVPADVRPLLQARMEATGRKESAIITEALRRYLAGPDGPADAPSVKDAE